MFEKIAWIFFTGGLGCVFRFLISDFFFKNSSFSIGTLVANIIGTLILGAVLIFASKSVVDSLTRDIIILGFCGGLTTFSTFSFQLANHVLNANYKLAAFDFLSNLLICFVVAVSSLKYIQKIN